MDIKMENKSDHIPLAHVEEERDAYKRILDRLLLEDRSKWVCNGIPPMSVKEGFSCFEIYQDGDLVASAEGRGAWQEIIGYAAQYAADGPIEIYEVVRIAVAYPLSEG